MDLPKKRSSRYVTIVYAMFIMLFAFTVLLFYLSRCQKSSLLTNKDDSTLKSEDSSENIKTDPEQTVILQDQSQNKIEHLELNNEADETPEVLPSEKVFSNEINSTIADLDTPPAETSNSSSTQIRSESSAIPSRNKVVINFSTDSTGLTDDALGKLKMIYEYLLKHPEEELIIEGYGDSSNNNQINEKLSQFRAEIVKGYFTKQGISGSKIKVFWMGTEKPEGIDEPQEQEDKNHRVEIQFKSESKGALKN